MSRPSSPCHAPGCGGSRSFAACRPASRAARGLVSGALISAITANATYTVATYEQPGTADVSPFENRYVVTGAVAGGVGGPLLGALFPAERWRRVRERPAR